jgi:5S rRNA maturation endonuclease (ribonuclease M5)
MGEDPRPFYDKPLINNGTTTVKNKTVTPKVDLTDKAEEYAENLGENYDKEYYIKAQRVGHHKGGLVFPYFDKDGNVDGLKYHKPNLHTEGNMSKRWYLEWLMEYYPRNEFLIIAEGETDALTLLHREYSVISSSGGCQSIPPILKIFKEFKEIIICYDNDDAGRRGAEKLAQAIYVALGVKCKIAKWREGLPDKYDISDDKDGKEFAFALDQGYEFRPKPTNSKKGFRVIKMGDIDNENFIKPEVIVRNLVEESCLTLIAGGTGVGKSWMSINLACCIATGQPLFGHFEVDKPRKVLLIQFELTDGQYKKRFDLMKGSFQSSSMLLSQNFNYVVIGEALSFTNQWDNIEAVLSGGEYDNGVLIVDNLYTSTDISMSDNSEITTLLSKMNYLMKKYNIALVVVAHNNKGVDKEGCISLDHIQGGAMLTRFASNIFQIQSSTLSGDYRIAKITKVRDEECNLLEIPFKLYWDTSTYTFIKGEIIPREKLHFLEASERWEIKLVQDIKSYEGTGNNPEKGGIWTRNDIWRFLELEGWSRGASNEVKVTRFLKRVCDWGLLEKVSHNQYRIITAELSDA